MPAVLVLRVRACQTSSAAPPHPELHRRNRCPLDAGRAYTRSAVRIRTTSLFPPPFHLVSISAVAFHFLHSPLY